MEIGPALKVSLIVVPPMPAVVIGASARSPFGDVEFTASRSLPALRFGHLAGLLLCGATVLGLAAYDWEVADIGSGLIRNLTGYAGLALLGARVLGSGIAWVAPLSYAVATLMVDDVPWWAWPGRLAIDQSSVAIAAALTAIGLLVVSLHGACESPGEFE
jgi:hypothetical protein